MGEMSKRPFCLLAGALAGVLFLARFASAQPAKKDPAKNSWNVLLISVDTLRADRLSCYGSDRVQTPNIDSLAAKGALFARAFAHTPTTLPSPTNLLPGMTPLGHSVHDNANFVVDKK